VSRSCQQLAAFIAANSAFLMMLPAALCFTIGAVCMKRSEGFTQPWPSALLVICFAAGTCLLTLAMHRRALSVTYITELGLEALLAVIFGYFLFEEQLSALKLAGVVAIVGGIAVLRV
jgi:quaternary ammonium compound-resistance protein SugE